VDSYAKTNRSLWDGWAKINASSTFYDVGAFRAGASSLKALERAELGEVSGRSLLHLQCHFGLDTLSWARLGATVTGVDFSTRAIATARALAEELAIPARFVESDVLELALAERFDVVFTSYGTICWLSDLSRWAGVVASHLEPGGIFYMVDFHPLASALSDDGARIQYPYLPTGRAELYPQKGSYADLTADFEHDSYEWHHGLGDIVTALIDAGLQLEFLREHPYSSHGCFPFAEEAGPDRWVVRGLDVPVPLMYSLRARAGAA